MHYQQDWIMRQIEVVIKFIRSILGKSEVEHHFESSTNSENELIKSKIENLIKYNRFDEAESIIFKKIDSDNNFDVRVAFWVFENVNSFSDIDLEKVNFSRTRILEGIRKVCQKSKVIDPDTIRLLINSIE